MDSALISLLALWQQIAEEAAYERDPKRLNDFSKKLQRALEEGNKQFNHKPQDESA